MSNKSIKIPDRLYIGLVPRNNKIPSAAITPYGTDKSAKNRMSNVDRAVGRSNKHSSMLGTTILENKPLNGFRFTGRAYNGSSHDFWYVEDPRGFEVEISSENLGRLLTSGIVDHGELLFPCVWARDGAVNVLLSTASQEYVAAIDNTAASKGKASWKDVRLGDTVLLRNNTQGRWMGKFYLVLNYGYGTIEGNLSANEYTVSDKAYHVIYQSNLKDNHYTSAIYVVSTPQLSKIIASDPLTEAESELLVNEYIQDNNCLCNSNLYRKIIAASFNMPKPDQFKILKEGLNPVTQDELNELVGNNYSTSIPNVYVETESLFGKVRNNPSAGRTGHEPFYIIEYSLPHINAAELRRVYTENINHRAQRQYSENHVKYTFDRNNKFYNLKLYLRTTLGNEVNLYIS